MPELLFSGSLQAHRRLWTSSPGLKVTHTALAGVSLDGLLGDGYCCCSHTGATRSESVLYFSSYDKARLHTSAALRPHPCSRLRSRPISAGRQPRRQQPEHRRSRHGHAVANIPEDIAGVHAHEVTVSADGRTAFLPIYGSSGVGRPGVDGDRMLFVDLTTHKIVGDLHFAHPVRPHLPVLDSKRNLLYVTTELDQSVTVIDPKTRKILGSIPTSQPESHMLVLSHSGRLGYTANVGPGTVSVLDLAGRKTVAVIPVSPKVQRISITNDDKFVFTSDQSKPQLAVIDTATNKVKSWVPLPGTGYGSAATPDGRSVLVAIPSTGQVAVVDLGSMKVTRTIDVPKTPRRSSFVLTARLRTSPAIPPDK